MALNNMVEEGVRLKNLISCVLWAEPGGPNFAGCVYPGLGPSRLGDPSGLPLLVKRCGGLSLGLAQSPQFVIPVV